MKIMRMNDSWNKIKVISEKDYKRNNIFNVVMHAEIDLYKNLPIKLGSEYNEPELDPDKYYKLLPIPAVFIPSSTKTIAS